MKAIEINVHDWMGLGVDAKELTLVQLVLRAIVVFPAMYFMIRIAGRRFMAQKNIFDSVLAFLLASMLARVINGSSSFWIASNSGWPS